MGRWPKCPRSAYSASPPVTTRNTAPSTTNPRRGSSAKKRAAWYGETAASTPGCRMISLKPSRPIVANQTSMTGPNTAPIRAVPRLCTRNKPIRITSVTGITHEASAGVAIRSEEHTSELQSRRDLVCRLLLEKKKKKQRQLSPAYNKKSIKTEKPHVYQY